MVGEERVVFDALRDGWNRLSEREPWWSALTLSEFRTGSIRQDSDILSREFYGEHALRDHIALLRALSDAGEELDPKERALDFGCGPGRNLFWLSDLFSESEVVGYDISRPNLGVARYMLGKDGVRNVWLREAVGVDLLLELGEESFGFIYSVLVFQHIPPPLSTHYLEQLGRVLQKGGLFFLHVLISGGIGQEPENPHGMYPVSIEEVRKVSGLSVIASKLQDVADVGESAYLLLKRREEK